MKKKFLVVLAILASVVLFLWGVWYVAVPTSAIEEAVEGNLAFGGVSVDIEGLSKGLLMSLASEKVDVRFRGQRLASVRDLDVHLEPSALARKKVAVTFEGEVGGGTLKGRAEFGGAGQAAEFTVSGARLSALELSERAGLNGDGSLDLEFRSEGLAGTLKFSVKELDLAPSRVLGVRVPAEEFREARGMVRFRPDRGELESVTLEGENFYARATGAINGGVADLEVELMPEGEESLDPALLAFIRNYRVSSGYYVIPVKVNIGFLLAQ